MLGRRSFLSLFAGAAALGPIMPKVLAADASAPKVPDGLDVRGLSVFDANLGTIQCDPFIVAVTDGDAALANRIISEWRVSLDQDGMITKIS